MSDHEKTNEELGGPDYVAPPFQKPAPRIEDFDYDSDRFQDAKDEWLVEKAEHKAYHKVKAETVAEQKRREAAKWGKKGVEKFPDFIAVISTHANEIPPDMATAVRDADNSHEIAYYLGNNPQEYDRIAKLSPVKQVKEIGKIEQKLSGNPAPAPSAKNTTNTDPPTSMEEYAKWREGQKW
jgi:hypothetical protein